MSVKIWEAYRLKPGVDFWVFVHDLRLRAEAAAKKVLENLYIQLLDGAKGDQDLRKEIFEVLEKTESAENCLSILDVARYVKRQYGKTLDKMLSHVFCLDAEIVVRYYDGNHIFIPYANGLMRRIFDFLKKDERVEDFHYQNQTDRDKNISEKDWEYRERVYYEMDEQDKWRDCLSLHIVDYDGYCFIDPWLELAKKHAEVKIDEKGVDSVTN